jgi:2-polyprenyl-3-methyl-5-hydroxy-6-metoxy-1,4-benzoquinol methylase
MLNTVNSPLTGGKVKKVGAISTALIQRNIKAQYRIVGSEISKMFNGIPFVDILECEDTGYKFYYPFFDAGEAFYNKIGREKDYYAVHRWEFDVALEYIEPVNKICEIGAGYGYFPDFLIGHKAITKDKYSGIELNANAVEVSRRKGYEMSNLLIQDFCKIHEQEFDVLCFFQVLEHVRDVDSFMRSALKVLKSNGKLLIAVPNNDAFVMKYDYLKGVGNVPPHHVGLWNRQSLVNMGKHYGLRLLTVKEQTLPPNLAGYYYMLKIKRKLGWLAPLIVLPTRWLVKIFLKRISYRISGPYIFVAFEK